MNNNRPSLPKCVVSDHRGNTHQVVAEMSKIGNDLVTWLVLVNLICAKCSYALEADFFDALNVNRIKNGIFSTDTINEAVSGKNLTCETELKAIGSGIKNSELWAIRIVDAWGKIPTGILEGNSQSFGSFSECFHIERNNKTYKSQYCSAQFKVNLKMLQPKSYDLEMKKAFLTNLFQTEEDVEITPRTDIGGFGNIEIGICVPADCSMDFLKSKIDDMNQDLIKSNMSISFREETCQFEESPSQLKTLDWITIGILTAVSLLMVMSTAYDILCTFYNRGKSQAFLAFSVYTNGMKLLSYEQSKSGDIMHCLNGIRVITTAWVVLGHTYAISMGLPVENKTIFYDFVSSYHNMIVFSAHISVDTFFVMSGLLVTIHMLKHLEKTKGRINVPLLYFHRYLRLTPLLAMGILISITLLRFMENGPLFPFTFNKSVQSCEKYWWTNLLYVQNYVNPKNLCFLQSWYLAVDMQLFLFSPFVVYLIYLFQLKAIVGMVLLVLGCVGCTLAVFVQYELKGSSSAQYNEKAYYPTHIRYSSWMIGVIAGYIFFKTRNRVIRIPKLLNLFAWTVSLITMNAVIFANYPFQQPNNEHTPLEFGLYDALSLSNNSGGAINSFLGSPLWQPLARLTYAIYIAHLPVIFVTMTVKTTIHISELSAFLNFVGNFVLSAVVAVIGTLAFESPIIILEKIVFGQQRNEAKAKNKNNE